MTRTRRIPLRRKDGPNQGLRTRGLVPLRPLSQQRWYWAHGYAVHSVTKNRQIHMARVIQPDHINLNQSGNPEFDDQ